MSASRVPEQLGAQSSVALGINSVPQQVSYYAPVPIGMAPQQVSYQNNGIAQSMLLASASTGASDPRSTDGHVTQGGTCFPKRIFVGGFPAQTTEAELKHYFSQHGSVTETKIIQDRAGVSKGYGFATFETAEEVNSILAKSQKEPFIFKDRKLNLGPAIRKNTAPTAATGQILMYAPNTVPINNEAGQTVFMTAPTTMQLADGAFSPYPTVPLVATAGAPAFYLPQQLCYMPQQQVASVNAIQVPQTIQASTQQTSYHFRSTPQSPPTPGGCPITPVSCHFTPGAPSSTSDFYSGDFDSNQNEETNSSTWGTFSWGSQMTYPSTEVGGVNLARELDAAADPFTIPDPPISSSTHDPKPEVKLSATVKSGGSGYVSSASSNASLYGNNNTNNNNTNGNDEALVGYQKSGALAGAVSQESSSEPSTDLPNELIPANCPLLVEPKLAQPLYRRRSDDFQGSDFSKRPRDEEHNQSLVPKSLNDFSAPIKEQSLETDPIHRPNKRLKTDSCLDEQPIIDADSVCLGTSLVPFYPTVYGDFIDYSSCPYVTMIPMIPNQFPISSSASDLCTTVNIEKSHDEILEATESESLLVP